ncbi:MAG: hypothetical protein PHG25_02740 [Candidatus Pacebacteria bacterium]|nr:hypothetical protein [Candidatus Paceibacterota bacterium]
MKALVLTRRTRLPASIRLSLNATSIQFVVGEITNAKPADAVMSLQKLINSSSPDIIAIDGDYGSDDARLWRELSELTIAKLRLRILSGIGLPESLKLLRLANAVKDETYNIVIFIEQPSDGLRAELRQLGALWVWPTLHKPSGLETSFHKTITGARSVAAGLCDLVAAGLKAFEKVGAK